MPAPLSRELREQIIALRLSGWKIKGIADWTGVSRKCIYFWLRRWEESGDLQAHHREQYKRKTTDEQDAAIIAARAADPTKSTRSLSTDYNISLDTVRRRLKAAGIMRGKPGKARKTPRAEASQQQDGFSWIAQDCIGILVQTHSKTNPEISNKISTVSYKPDENV